MLAIGWSDLFYLFAMRALREDLTPKARTEFYEALQQSPIDRRDEVRVGRFRTSISDLLEDVERRTTDLTALAEAFASEGGDGDVAGPIGPRAESVRHLGRLKESASFF